MGQGTGQVVGDGDVFPSLSPEDQAFYTISLPFLVLGIDSKLGEGKEACKVALLRLRSMLGRDTLGLYLKAAGVESHQIVNIDRILSLLESKAKSSSKSIIKERLGFGESGLGLGLGPGSIKKRRRTFQQFKNTNSFQLSSSISSKRLKAVAMDQEMGLEVKVRVDGRERERVREDYVEREEEGDGALSVFRFSLDPDPNHQVTASAPVIVPVTHPTSLLIDL